MFKTSAAMAALCLAAAGSIAYAQEEAPPAVSSASPEAAPTAPVPAAQSTPDPPHVAYVVRNVRPQLIDLTPSKGAFAMVGVVAATATGAAIVSDNDIANPSVDVAHAIAEAYARAHGYGLVDRPLVVDKEHPLPSAREAQAAAVSGARYLVDAEPPGQTLLYFPLEWTKFDLIYLGRVRVIDLETGKAIETAICSVKNKNRPGLLSHSELLADKAAGLKALMKAKAAECADQIRTKLKLPVDVAEATPPAPQPAPR